MALKDLLNWIKPFRLWLALATLSMMLESIAVLLSPWIAGQFAHIVLSKASVLSETSVLPETAKLTGTGVLAETAQLTAGLSVSSIIGLWLFLFTCQAGLRFLSAYLITTSGAKILTSLSRQVYDHLQVLPMAFHQRHQQGDLLALISHDLNVIAQFVTGTLTSIAPLTMTFVGALIMMVLINSLAALLVLILVPAFYLLIKLLGKTIRPLSEALAQAQAESLAHVQHNLSILPALKAFNRENLESRRYAEKVQSVLGIRLKLLTAQALLSPMIQWVASCAILLLLWLLSQQLISEQISAAQVISLIFYGLLLSRPVSSLAGLYGQVQQVRGSSQRLHRMLQQVPEASAGGKLFVAPARGNIAFHGVSFCYPERAPIWSSLNLKIAAGETVAITGPNGAGKTTLLNMLLGFIKPQQGKVLIDGQDIYQYSLASLREQMGLVSQNILLSDESVANNIRYGRPEASDAEVERAARQSGVHEFVARLPQGYDTAIGELGQKLSGGQRQRIALARALLKGSPILLLDEATSMLDPQGEKQFIQQIRNVLKQHTVLLVTHSHENLALADRILHIENGQLSEVSA